MSVTVEEARAFDRQILERVRHGHLPDLRRAEPCDYFYNNSWRHPEYVGLDFGEIFELIRAAIRDHTPSGRDPGRVIEIGCGPGHFSLELSRAGFDVTGIDLSQACIDVARRVADKDPWRDRRGGLRYVCADILDPSVRLSAPFDAAVFVGALHHFPDQDGVLARVEALLAPGGLILVDEPTRDRVTPGNLAFVHLLRSVLSAAGGFHEHVELPVDVADIETAISRLRAELTCTDGNGNNTQSPHDNEAGHAEMLPALLRRFDQVDYRDRYAFFHELIGGLRFDEPTNVSLARSLRAFDAELCRLGVLQPTEFFFVGRRRRELP